MYCTYHFILRATTFLTTRVAICRFIHTVHVCINNWYCVYINVNNWYCMCVSISTASRAPYRLMRKPHPTATKSFSHEPTPSNQLPVESPKNTPVGSPRSKKPPVVPPLNRQLPSLKDKDDLPSISTLQEKLRKRLPRSLRNKQGSEQKEYRPLRFWRSAPRVVSAWSLKFNM